MPRGLFQRVADRTEQCRNHPLSVPSRARRLVQGRGEAGAVENRLGQVSPVPRIRVLRYPRMAWPAVMRTRPWLHQAFTVQGSLGELRYLTAPSSAAGTPSARRAAGIRDNGESRAADDVFRGQLPHRPGPAIDRAVADQVRDNPVGEKTGGKVAILPETVLGREVEDA
jgi:hypothetical protein